MKHDYSDQHERFKAEQRKEERTETVITVIFTILALGGIAAVSIKFWSLF